MACSCAPRGAVATAARPDEPSPKTTRSLPDIFTAGDVLEDEAAMTSTGELLFTPAKAIVTAATPFLGEMRTRIPEGTDRPVTVRHTASRVPAPWVWFRISRAPERQLTLAPRRVSINVSRMSPVLVPVGTAVMARPAFMDSKVVAVPTWVMVVAAVDARGIAAVVDVSRGTTLIPVATIMIPIVTPMMAFQ